mgnify:CR=1 FL=1
MGFEKQIPSNVEVVNILGINDKNLKYIKSVFPNVRINVKGNTIHIDGQDKDAKEIMRIFDEMLLMNDNDENIEETTKKVLLHLYFITLTMWFTFSGKIEKTTRLIFSSKI